MKRFLIVILSLVLVTAYAPKSLAASDDITGHYFESAIRTLVQKEIMGGYGDGIYKPNNAVTRAEFAALVIRSLKETAGVATVSKADNVPFSDVPQDSWYYSVVNEAVAAGIVGGYPDGTFKPNNSISRQEMAAMIWRAISARGIFSEKAPLTYKDKDQINPIFTEAVQHLSYLGVMAGNADNTFGPRTTTTRGQMAAVLLRMIKLLENKPVTEYSNYDLTIEQMIDKQMAINPQTDKYRNDPAFVSAEYITDITEEDGKQFGFITEDTTFLNVREGAGTEHRQVGRFSNNPEKPTKVEIVTAVVNEKSETWYQVKYNAWRNAKRSDVAQYVNPANVKENSQEYFQFLVLSKRAGATAEELNNFLVDVKPNEKMSTLEGQGQAFIEASKTYGLNEIYLVAHALHETGEGESELAQGVEIEEIVLQDANGKPILDANGQLQRKPIPKTKVYNVYGIRAVDICPVECGASWAYTQGWTTVEDAIIGGAEFISKDYINEPNNQDTLYKMRWNPNNPGVHQYASDVGWAAKQVSRMYDMYSQLRSYRLYYDIPVYKNEH